MPYRKDVERLARSLHGQKLEREYIKHYLMEIFQLDDPAIEDIMNKVGVAKKVEAGKGRGAPSGDSKPVNRQQFY
jgi:hypothetical protein